MIKYEYNIPVDIIQSRNFNYLPLTFCRLVSRVAVVGNVDAGKSTLLGVLTHGELDNGRGFARQKLFRHKHEMESGRTSSVGNDILGFDQEGQVSRGSMTVLMFGSLAYFGFQQKH